MPPRQLAPGEKCDGRCTDAIICVHPGEKMSFWRSAFYDYPARVVDFFSWFRDGSGWPRSRVCWRWTMGGPCWKVHRGVRQGVVRRADGLFRVSLYLAQLDHDRRVVRKECFDDRGRLIEGHFMADCTTRLEIDTTWDEGLSCRTHAPVEVEFQNFEGCGDSWPEQIIEAERRGFVTVTSERT